MPPPQASIPYAASAGNHNNLPSLNNQFFVNQAGQPLRANDLAMLQLQQQLQGLSVMTPAATNAGFANQTRCDPYTNQVASAQAFARLQQQQQQQTQLLAAQLQAATAGSNLSTLQINALRQTLAAKQQAAMPAGQPKAMAVIAEASRIAALRAQQQQLAQSLQGGPPSGLHAATIQSLLAQGHGAQQQPPASVHHHSQPAQQHVQDSHFKDKLVEMGVGLAQNNITIETAVNAGLLGGLSASDVRILAAAHRAEARRQELARHGTYGGISQALPPQSMARFPPPPAAPNKMMMSHNTFMPSSTNNNVVGHAEPQALFDASKLGTSLFGGSVASGAASDTPSALQQKGFFSFFGNDDTDEQPVQDDDDDAKSSADNTTGTLPLLMGGALLVVFATYAHVICIAYIVMLPSLQMDRMLRALPTLSRFMVLQQTLLSCANQMLGSRLLCRIRRFPAVLIIHCRRLCSGPSPLSQPPTKPERTSARVCFHRVSSLQLRDNTTTNI